MAQQKYLHHIKRITIALMGAAFIAFLVWNVIWLIRKDASFGIYTDKMEKAATSTLLVPRYFYRDEDGFTYSVKYPDYLAATGNLSLTASSDEFNSLLIWIGINGDREYGVIVSDDSGQYQIYIDEKGNALYDADAAIIERNKELIDLLLSKAKSFWTLH